MIRWFSRLFNITPAEWPRVLLLFLILVLTQLGAIWGTTTAYSFFLNQVGLDFLPRVMAFSTVLSIIAVAIYTTFADRVANQTLLVVLYILMAVFIAAGLVVLSGNASVAVYSALYLAFMVWGTVFDSLWGAYVNSLYDIQAAKRILPVVSAGSRSGVIMAGFTMPLLNARLHPEGIILVWLIVYVVIVLVAAGMPYLLGDRKHAVERKSEPKPVTNYLESMREGYHYTIKDAYLRWIMVGALFLSILLSLIEYKSTGLLLESLGSREKLSNYLALMLSIGNALVLPTLLFGLSRLIARIGLANGSLIFPAGNLVVCGGLVFLPGLASATAAYFDRTAFRAVFQVPISSLLYNAVPLRLRGRARAFVEGLVRQFGSLVGWLLLLIILPLLAPTMRTWLVAGLIGVMALGYLIASYITRQQYSRALVKMLEDEDYSFLMAEESFELPMADPATLHRLQQKLEQSTSHELTVFMAQLITQIGGAQALDILAPAIRSQGEARTRAAMVDVLAASRTRTRKASDFYYSLLQDPDGLVRQAAIAGLEQLVDPNDQQYRPGLLRLLDDPDLNVRTRALISMAAWPDFYRLPQATRALEQFLRQPQPAHRMRGVKVLGKVNQPQAIHSLMDYLCDPSDPVRLEAALAVEAQVDKMPSTPLSGRTSRRATEDGLAALTVVRVTPLLRDPVERIRQASLMVLARLGERITYPLLVDALSDPSPAIRNMAIDLLVSKGKEVISYVEPRLNSAFPQVRKLAPVVLCRVSPREFGQLVMGGSITSNLLTIYRDIRQADALECYKAYAGPSLLQRALREQGRQLAQEIIYLLGALHPSETINVIRESMSSTDPRVRADAHEAMEALTSPQMAKLIAAVFNPDLTPAEAQALSVEAWNMNGLDCTQTLRQLSSDTETPFLQALAIYAVGELGTYPDSPFSRQEIERILQAALDGGDRDVTAAVRVAQHMLACGHAGVSLPGMVAKKEDDMLSTIDRIIFLKEVPFFADMTVEQLKVLANVCEEVFFEKDTTIFKDEDPGGTLYVVVNGRVGIEQEKRAGSFARLADVEAHSYFGEANFFDNSPCSTSAVAIQDTLALKLRREPLIALARQNPELSLELINVLSQRLREANDRIADLTRSKPRALHQLYDQL